MICVAKNGKWFPMEGKSILKNGSGTVIPEAAKMRFAGNWHNVGQTSYPAWSSVLHTTLDDSIAYFYGGNRSIPYYSWVIDFEVYDAPNDPDAGSSNTDHVGAYFYPFKVLIKHASCRVTASSKTSYTNQDGSTPTRQISLYAITKAHLSLTEISYAVADEFSLIGTAEVPYRCSYYDVDFNVINEIPCHGYEMRATFLKQDGTHNRFDGYIKISNFEAWSTDTKPTT